LRRRGYTPASIRNFSERVGVAKRDSLTDISLLEYSIREDLNKSAQRVMGVLRPLKIEIINYDEALTEHLEAVNNPEDPSMGTRQVPFSRYLYIEREDFQEEPHKKFFRLAPDREVRLRYAFIIKCEKVIKDDEGNVIELKCTYDPDTKSGSGKSNKKVKGTIHWVSQRHAVNAEVRLYDRLFNDEDPGGHKDKDFIDFINPDSLEVLKDAKLEPLLSEAIPGDKYQFERQGYFCLDTRDSTPEKLVFNRTVSLRDTWAKIVKKG
jgi:glutaminyl-tRNA synthetase